MNILAIDTCGEGLSLAVGGAGRRCRQRRLRTRKADERIFPTLRVLLKGAGLGLRDLDAVVAANGPGRFTGIRIGMTFARMLGDSLGVPVAAVSRFAALAAAEKKPVRRCLVLPAGRGDIYLQVFTPGRDGRPQPAGAPRWHAQAEGEAELARLTKADGVLVTRYEFDRGGPLFPASLLLKAAREKLAAGAAGAFRPLYLRLANYELKRGR
ncbi:MAG: tRNA (adenosine(37)-N6)-threonylcarbamoyltransferase complex dimerization subunit type 1 TsaB [Elusimicrobiota bacterium]